MSNDFKNTVFSSAEVRIRIMRISGYPGCSNSTDAMLQIRIPVYSDNRISELFGYPDTNSNIRILGYSVLDPDLDVNDVNVIVYNNQESHYLYLPYL